MPPPQKWVVIDNGFNLKVCKSSGLLRTGPNAVVIRRSKGGEVRTAHEEVLKTSANTGNLYWLRATTKGFLSDIHLEAEIWSTFLDVNDEGSSTVVTTPILSPLDVIYGMLDLAIQKFKFSNVHVVSPQLLSLIYFHHKPSAFSSIPDDEPKSISIPRLTGVIIDIGSTCSTVISYNEGVAIPSSYRRIPIGGQTITGYIQLGLARRNPYVEISNAVAEAVKERVGFVTPNLMHEVKRRKGMDRAERKREQVIYCLPDGHTVGDSKGFIVPKDKMDKIEPGSISYIHLSHEVYTIPEMLFCPQSDFGGVPEAIQESISSCPSHTQPEMWSSLIATGGGVLLSGFIERLYNSVRELAPSEFPVVLHYPNQNSNSLKNQHDQTAVRGGVAALQEHSFKQYLPKPITSSDWSSVRGKKSAATDLIKSVWNNVPTPPPGDSSST